MANSKYCPAFSLLLFLLSLSFCQSFLKLTLSSSLSITLLSLPLLFPTYLPHKQACFMCICMFASCTQVSSNYRSGTATGYRQERERPACLTSLCYDGGRSRLLQVSLNLKLSFSRLQPPAGASVSFSARTQKKKHWPEICKEQYKQYSNTSDEFI